MKAPASICVLRLSALGDVCNAVAAIQSIQKSFPECAITWVVGKLEHSLVEGLDGIEFIVFDKKQNSAIKNFKQAMRGRKFDVLLHMQVAARANRLATLIPAKRKIGYDWQRAKEGHSLVINSRIPSLPHNSPRQHVLDSFFDFAMKLGVRSDECYPPEWNIPTSVADKEFASLTIPAGAQTMVICPAASKRERCWPAERYADIAHYIHRRGINVVLCGGPSDLDHELAQGIIKHSRIPITNLIGKTSLKQLYCLLGRALFVLAPDTGPLHLANAAGTPVVGLYAHSNPARTGPYNSQSYVANAYLGQLQRQYGKTPEFVKWGQRVHGSELMLDITVKQVCEKIDTLLLELD